MVVKKKEVMAIYTLLYYLRNQIKGKEKRNSIKKNKLKLKIRIKIQNTIIF